jgi:hypothetical protein
MLINSNLSTTLGASIDATQTVIPLKSTGSLSSLLVNGDYGFLEISDGINKEVVKVLSVSANSATVERGMPSFAFIAGSCAQTDKGFKTICELIAQGGCNGSSVCTPVSRGTFGTAIAEIGKPYSNLAVFPNATSITIQSKPSWMTATVDGTIVTLSGTPVAGASDELVIVANGCNSSVSLGQFHIHICEPITLTP